jgi:hypothetical protein
MGIEMVITKQENSVIEIAGLKCIQRIDYGYWESNSGIRYPTSTAHILCPLCGKDCWGATGLRCHISASTRNSDLAHARLYMKMFPNNKHKIEQWKNKHDNGLKILKELQGEMFCG